MKKIQEILDQFNERFSNPFIFSYVLSWIIFNWKIVVALLWYDSSQIKLSGANSIFDFIEINSDMERGVLYPLIGAFAYTFGMPIFKNVVKAFNSWASKWGTNWSLNILKNGQISVNKYLKLRDEYQERTKILSDVIAQENEYIERFGTLQTENLEIKDRNNELSRKIIDCESIIDNFSNSKILDGRWEVISDDDKGNESKKEIFIESMRYYEIITYENRREKYFIRDFTFQKRYNVIFFICQNVKEDFIPYVRKFDIVKLDVISQDSLIGELNYSKKIQYKRINAPN